MKYFHIKRADIPGIASIGEMTARQLGADSVLHQIGRTVERPWKSNEPFKSCISVGEYDIIEHTSGSKNKWADGRVLVLQNANLGVMLRKGDAIRYACYIHSANYPWEVEGCIAPGLGLHPTRWGVVKSVPACKLVFDYFDNGWNKLVIE